MSPTQSELPPYEMNGRVIPVIGTRLATTAMFTQAWKQSQIVTPVASKAPVESSARSAMRTPRNASARKSSTMTSAPASPSSSPSTAKMESVYGWGR